MGDLLLDALVWVLGRTPLRLAAALCRLLSWVWWVLIPVRRDVALANLERAFPAMTGGQRGRLLRRTLYELALGYVELVRFLRRPAEREAMVQHHGIEPLEQRVRAGLSSIVIAGHSGSWDLGGLSMSDKTDLRPVIPVRTPTHAWTAAFIADARARMGMHALPTSGCREEIQGFLEEGATLFFYLDQRLNDGLQVPFFGQPARTAPSAAALARSTGLPVYLMWQWRLGVGRHRMQYTPLSLHWTQDRDADIQRVTAQFTLAIEQQIRQHPHGWLWLHRRWRGGGE